MIFFISFIYIRLGDAARADAEILLKYVDNLGWKLRGCCCFEASGLDYERRCESAQQVKSWWWNGSCNEGSWVKRDLWRVEWDVYVRWMRNLVRRISGFRDDLCLMVTSSMVRVWWRLICYVRFVAATNESATAASWSFGYVRLNVMLWEGSTIEHGWEGCFHWLLSEMSIWLGVHVIIIFFGIAATEWSCRWIRCLKVWYV